MQTENVTRFPLEDKELIVMMRMMMMMMMMMMIVYIGCLSQRQTHLQASHHVPSRHNDRAP